MQLITRNAAKLFICLHLFTLKLYEIESIIAVFHLLPNDEFTLKKISQFFINKI